MFYNILQSSTETRNDLNIYHEFDTLDQITLDTWYDVGNIDSYNFATQEHESNYKLLDKTNQEIYVPPRRKVQYKPGKNIKKILSKDRGWIE